MIGEGAGSRRRALLRRVQIALKPATKTRGLHGVIIRGKGRKYVMADSAFKRMQVDACVASIIAALHFGQAGRPIAMNGMTDDRG
jgi:phage terminase large subunit-like protein